MFTHYLRFSYLFFILVSFSFSVYADAYKWIDDNESTHYSERAPLDPAQDFELISPPPPPTIDPIEAQKKVDTLIEQLEGTYEEKEKEREQVKRTKAKQEKKDEYCTTIKQNLNQYKNNPGRRLMDENGNIIKPNEEQRQQKMTELKQEIEEYCQ